VYIATAWLYTRLAVCIATALFIYYLLVYISATCSALGSVLVVFAIR